jgi:lipopolysaccharide export system protein LptC
MAGMNKLPRPLPLAKPTLSRRLYQAWDLALAYMPLFMLSMLLLLSIWLVRNATQPEEKSLPAPVSHIADYEFTNFILKSYDINGQIRSALKGAHAEHFQDTQNTWVKSPEVMIYSEKKITKAKALQGLTNEDGSEVQLIGKAQVIQESISSNENDQQIDSDFLHFFSRTDKVITHVPVYISHGKDTFKADAMEADNVNQSLKLKGRVRVKIFPNQD